MIPISAVSLNDDVEALVLEVLRSGTIAQGPKVAQLEHDFAAMIGVDHVVAVNNGTAALIAALRGLGIGPGDEVITSPFTFVATLNAILDVGATARFADISAVDFNVDPDRVAALVGPATAALLPVHLYGQPADMPRISAISARHGLHLVEDAAQAHGARIAGRAAGAWGVGCFSLYATKNLTAGEGGLIATDDEALAGRLRVLRNQGMRERYVYETAGTNYRLTDLQAAVCIPQLKDYAHRVEARRRNAALLSDGLAGLPGVTMPRTLPDREHVWHQYTILVDGGAAARDGLVARLASSGIGSGVYYPRPVFEYDCYRDHPRVLADEVPVTRSVAARCVSLPVHPGVGEPEIERIVAAVRDAIGA